MSRLDDAIAECSWPEDEPPTVAWDWKESGFEARQVLRAVAEGMPHPAEDEPPKVLPAGSPLDQRLMDAIEASITAKDVFTWVRQDEEPLPDFDEILLKINGMIAGSVVTLPLAMTINPLWLVKTTEPVYDQDGYEVVEP